MECVFRQFIIQPIMIWLAIKPPNVPPPRKYSKNAWVSPQRIDKKLRNNKENQCFINVPKMDEI